MGADIDFYKVKCKRSELDKEANDLREQCRYDFGNSGYTGTIAEDSGDLTIVSTEMTIDEAETYIDENAEKWENSIAIKVKDKVDVWVIGGIYSC